MRRRFGLLTVAVVALLFARSTEMAAATVFPTQTRDAGVYASATVPVPNGRLRSVGVQFTYQGLTPQALADPTLHIVSHIQCTTDATGASGWFDIYGPDDWSGGNLSHAGTPLTPDFAFQADSALLDNCQRARALVETNQRIRWGLDVALFTPG